MTTLSKSAVPTAKLASPLAGVNLDSAVQEIVSSREWKEPTESFLGSTRRYLERNGWMREVAGDADFEAACRAWGMCIYNGLGIFAYGKYGCGKTALMRLFHPLLKPSHFVPLGDPECVKCLTDGEWLADAMDCNVFLDDLGAESAFSNYGVKRDAVGEFILRYYAQRVRERGKEGPARRLFITTNLTGRELAERYTMRITSRIKELCIPLHLKGSDKRRWGGAEAKNVASVEMLPIANANVANWKLGIGTGNTGNIGNNPNPKGGEA